MYIQIKRRVCDIIRDDGHRSLANRIFGNCITSLIIVNIVMVILDLLEVFPESGMAVFAVVETVSVAVFTVEYILRLWIADLLYTRIKPAKARVLYACLPMSLVDIVAILPFYLPLAFPFNMTVLRLLRLLRLLRILKLNRHSDAKTSEVVLSSIKEAIVLIDSDHNFLSANKAAEAMFPSLKGIKKYMPVTQASHWPGALARFDENDIKESIYFNVNDETYHRADISQIYDREKLLRYIIIIQDITESVMLERAEKEREKSDLMIAAKIQASMLPGVSTVLTSGSPAFDIDAMMDPAKEIGGDFYDFFYIDENKLAVAVADVSGKGIPAALFMVNAKTQLKNAAQQGKPLPEVMEFVNDLLCEGNDECMFVTLFIGVLEIPTGRFYYVNGGHDVPLIKHGEHFSWLPTRPGLMLGFMDGTQYVQDETTLQKGDVLFLYTDGVTEAENPGKQQLTEERLKELMNRHEFGTSKDILAHIRREIDVFADGAEQTDDITMLALRIL